MSFWALGAASAPLVVPLLTAALNTWKRVHIERSRARLVIDILACTSSRGVVMDIRDDHGGSLCLRLNAETNEPQTAMDPAA